MINKTELYRKFGEAVRWNSFLFFINKISKTTISFFLFYKLTQNDFSLWANIYSLIFILTLWTDFGFSRSLPQFCLVFAKNSKSKNGFIKKVIFFKILVSLAANIAFFIFSPFLISLLKLTTHKIYFYLGTLLFFTESIKSVLRLIFYSYFWQKTFNFIESLIITAQLSMIFLTIRLLESSSAILLSVFTVEITSCTIMILIAFLMLKKVKEDKGYQGQKQINEKQLMKEFIKHSSIMWSIISINSLTERNFLLPFFTFTLGPALANIFKVANDAALLFQRFVIKSIGTTGTSLLAHVEVRQVKKGAVAFGPTRGVSQQATVKTTAKSEAPLLREAFYKLNRRIISLVLPLFGILLLIYLLWKSFPFYKTSGFIAKLSTYGNCEYLLFKTFLILTVLYLVQILFMAYERILEVKRNYKELFISFTPYLGIILFLILGSLFKNCMVYLSLIPIILILHLLRIISLIIRIVYAKIKYQLGIFL